MDTFLRGHPLPKELAHLEYHIRELPVRAFLEFLIDASLANMALDDICASLKAAAEFYKTDNHRCAACLSWSNDVCGFTILFDDEAVMITVCERCKRKVERKQATPAMERNLRSYIREGLRK